MITTEAHPTLSVVMTTHDEARLLEDNLPKFLSAACDHPFEVIVVDDASTDDTPDVLKRLRATFPHLYTTFIPRSVPNPHRRRLALTIGAKAAKGEWIVLSDISRPPQSDEWLSPLAADAATEAVLVYTGRRIETGVRHQSFSSLGEAAPLIVKAERHSGLGHRGRWQHYRRGLYDALSVKRDLIHEAIALFDQPVGPLRLASLRLHVTRKNLFIG